MNFLTISLNTSSAGFVHFLKKGFNMAVKNYKSHVVTALKKQLNKRDHGNIPTWQLYSILLIGTLIVIFNQTSIKTALPVLIADIGVSPSVGQWTISGYSLVKGIMVPITALAMTKFRTRNLFNIMLGIFGIGSFIAALGFNFFTVLIGTLLQGVGAGMIVPLVQTIILTTSPPEKRGSAMGFMAVVIGLGPALGPAFGGWIVDVLSWNVLFYLWFLGTIIVIPLAMLIVPDVLPNSNLEIDWHSIRDSLIGFGLLLYGLSVIGSEGFNSLLAWLGIVVGIIYIYRFIKKNYFAKEPMLNIRLFKHKKYTISVIISMFAIMSVSASANIMPMYIQTVRELPALISGLVILPGGLIRIVLSPVVGKIFDEVGISVLGKLGGLLMFLGPLLLTTVSETTPIWLVVLYHLLLSAGFGVFNIPITTAGMNVLTDEEMSHGTTARQTVRQIGISFAITVSFVSMSIINTIVQPVGMKGLLSVGGVRGGFGAIAVFGFIAFILTFFISDETK